MRMVDAIRNREVVVTVFNGTVKVSGTGVSIKVAEIGNRLFKIDEANKIIDWTMFAIYDGITVGNFNFI